MKRLILLAVVLAVGMSLAGWRGRFDEQFAAASLPSGPLPAGWTECEYLESTGTQYINTGFAPTLYTSEIEVDCMSLAPNNRMWGVTESIGGVYSRIAEYFTSVGTIQMFPTTPGNHSSWGLGHAISNRAVVALSANKVYVDGVLKFTHVGPGAIFTKPMFVLGDNNAGTPALGKSRLYRCRIWSSGVPVRDYLPALDGDGVPCLYDAVTQAAFYNAGTGDFLYQIKEQ